MEKDEKPGRYFYKYVFYTNIMLIYRGEGKIVLGCPDLWVVECLVF